MFKVLDKGIDFIIMVILVLAVGVVLINWINPMIIIEPLVYHVNNISKGLEFYNQILLIVKSFVAIYVMFLIIEKA